MQVLLLGYMPLEETTALKAHSHRDVKIYAWRPFGALTCKFRNTAAITVAFRDNFAEMKPALERVRTPVK